LIILGGNFPRWGGGKAGNRGDQQKENEEKGKIGIEGQTPGEAGRLPEEKSTNKRKK